MYALIILILITSYVLANDKSSAVSKSESADNNKDNTDNTNIDTPFDAKAKIALEVIKLLRSESSLTIGSLNKGEGFTDLSNTLEMSHGSILIDSIPQLLELFIDDDMFQKVNPEIKNSIKKTIREYSLQLKEDKYKKQKQSLNFHDGYGVYYMIIVSFDPHPKRTDAVLWSTQILYGSFVPSHDWVIVTESDCNILSCDRVDRISYLPAKITDGHMRAIVNINADMLNGFSNDKQISS